MSDDRIIDFNELKNKVKDSDVDKFENYMYDLYFSVADGSMTMSQFTSKIYEYMRENNISQEKFIKMQNKLLERYGVDPKELDKQMKNFGLDPNNLNLEDLNKFTYNSPNVGSSTKKTNNTSIDKNSDFYKKYSENLQSKELIITSLKDEVNDIKIIIEKEKVTLISEGKINLVDAQLNELLLSYKSMYNDKLKVVICENCKEYDY
ncbi:MAG: DUF3867 domain-containing protein [Clostridiales bacterium]|uniref:DUF3867 domain-containing protein n=1 Tax=Terrisporobacter sp. TaxID=1965305 RepID=UPI002A4546D0|nr:DUF3867 domain-containing protein [Terrisporobacter sp.]MCI5629016.1 DUF3867 domain-containing protein [Clostridium sp.]MDD5878562.1 DUF3867 domain-containing protein [Clostridiales bacterium]MCI6456188.1 DUF3867 domain-containing protein [Clostridium sp.]MCI7205304.1 DUF3867 domain-containing protein [Clostridium sp.]MDD7753010.1 DUF3867 domain-containing protein [Clostridiales bacterium]